MGEALQTVVETPEFISQAKRLLSEAQSDELLYHLAANPTAGDVIPGTGGARKLRWALSGRGKSGGVRVITFYSGATIPVFLLGVFAKNRKIDLSQAERNQLRATLSQIVAEYRKRR